MSKSTYFDNQNNMCSDSCWMEYKNYGNNKILNYSTYEQASQLMPCVGSNARIPEFMLDHPNLRGRPGYGLSFTLSLKGINSLFGSVKVC